MIGEIKTMINITIAIIKIANNVVDIVISP